MESSNNSVTLFEFAVSDGLTTLPSCFLILTFILSKVIGGLKTARCVNNLSTTFTSPAASVLLSKYATANPLFSVGTDESMLESVPTLNNGFAVAYFDNSTLAAGDVKVC